MNGTLIAISVSERRGTRKRNVARARIIAGHGIEGDAHAGKWHRQVSLLAQESVEKMLGKGLQVGPGDFGENLTTREIDLSTLKIGDRLRIGSTVELEITQHGKECHEPCVIYREVGDCVMPRDGVFTRVFQGGVVVVGDPIVKISFGEQGN